MPVAVAAMVGPADFRVRRGNGLLTCVALTSGACLCLFDPESGVGGMAHITHCESSEMNPSRPGKYASSGVDALIQAMERTGAHRGRLLAAFAGGSDVTVNDGIDGSIRFESNVCRSVERELARLSIQVVGADAGGQEDRSVIFDVAAGKVRVKTQSGERSAWDMRNSAGLKAAA